MAQFTQWLNTAWEWLNKPLPVVGLSTLIICLFVIKFISMTSFGKKQLKKLNDGFKRIREQTESAKSEYQEFKNNVNSILDDKQKEIDYLKGIIKELCDTLPNKKVKAIGEKVYGERKEESND